MHPSFTFLWHRLGRAGLAGLLLLPLLGQGQVLLTGTNPSVTQAFDALPAPPTVNAPFTDNSTIPGVYGQRTGTGNLVVVGDGSANSGALYSFGPATGATTDRALGSVGSNNAAAGGFAYGLQFRNTTSNPITSLTLTYTGEQWRNGGVAAVQVIDFSYQISTTAITSLAPTAGALAAGVTTAPTPAAYTAVPALNFTSPTTSTTAAALNGNGVANRTTLMATIAVNIPVNSYIMLRWGDPDHNSSDHGLSIDDVTAAFTNGAAPVTTIATGTITGSPFCVGQTTASNTVAVPFTSTGTFTTGNVYTAYIGTTAIGTLASTASFPAGSPGIISATIPSSVVSGTTYRIRVDASTPATTGTDNGTDLTVVNYKTNEVTAYTATPGNTTVALAWTLPATCATRVVIIARQGSAVTVSPTGAFTADAAFGSGTDLGTGPNPNQFVVYDGPGTSVTVTNLTNTSQYFFKAFTSNGDGFSNGTSVSATPSAPLGFTEVLLPQLLVGHAVGASTHPDRLPFAFRASVSGLTPNATYRYYNAAVEPTDGPTSTGSGNPIFPVAAGGFARTSGPSLVSAGNYGTLLADGTGAYTGWFVLEPTGSARFDAGKALQMRLVLNDGNNGTAAVSFATLATTVAVRQLGAAAAQATGVQGASRAPASNFVFTYDNTAGTGRPLAGTFVESDGSANTVANNYTAFYGSNVDAQAGAWGLLTANDNANGIRYIEQRDLATGALVGCPATSATGTYPSGTATASPSGGTTPLVITQLDAPLTCEVLVGFNPTTAAVAEGNTGTTSVLLSVSVTGTPASPLTVTVADAGTGTATAGTDYTYATQVLTFTAPGTQTVSLTLIGDRVIEPNETVLLSLTTSGGPATAISSSATLTLLDDDTVAPTLLLEEDFNYPVGTVLADNNATPSTTTGWKAHSGNGSNNIPTIAGSLPQPQYPQGAAPATSAQAQLQISGQDISKPFAAPATLGTLYYTAVVNVSAAQNLGDYFFHLYDNTSAGGTLRGRVFARSSAGGINFGVSVSGANTAATWAPTDYLLNTNYLLVVKYNTNGTATITSDDVMSLYVLDNTGTPATEPAVATASAGPDAGAAAAPAGLNAVALRQGSPTGSALAATLNLDGVRVATNWGTAVGRPTFTTPTGGLNAYLDAITGTYVGNYYDATVNNNDQVSVSGAPTIENNLTLTSGLVITNTANLLTLAAAATVTGGSSTSFVSGPLARATPAGAATSVFPIGKGTAYRPLTLTATAQTAAATYTAEQFEGDPGQTVDAPVVRVSRRRSYTVTSSSVDPTNFTGRITLSFGSDDYVNVPNDASLVVAKRDAATANAWTTIGHFSETGGSGSGSGGAPVSGDLTSNSFSGFSDFVLGTTSTSFSTNPLPVELMAFNAQRQADKAVNLRWVTASEQNSARFEVQRSSDGREYTTVATATAQGSSTHATAYAALDKMAPASRLYYRLRQVDRDGRTSFSPVVLLAGAGEAVKVQLYPNPAQRSLSFTAEGVMPYRVLNQLGQTLLAGTTATGTTTLAIEALSPGLYLLELQTATGRQVQKFEKE